MADQREMSVLLNAILEMVGVSEEVRSLHQSMADIIEKMTVVNLHQISGELLVINRCGSSYEGTITPDLVSDVDVILCLTKPLVVPHPAMAGPGEFLKIVRDEWTRPGYVKLQHIWDGRPLTVFDIDAGVLVGFDRKGRACRKVLDHGNMHGPAQMFVDDNGRHYQDNVTAQRCKGIPLFATDWITRHRPYGWPSQQLIDELKMMGCLFVGVGHFQSPEKDIEWRLSFSLQERRLMQSLNPIQHKVYVLLKMTKKNVLETALKEETLSSYHCKTCVFYMAETTPANMWVPANLISCLLKCLKLLLQWIRNRFCPSYFLKDVNLFDKEGFSRHMYSLERLLGLILHTGHEFLYLIQNDRIGEILRHGDLTLHMYLSGVKLLRYICTIKSNAIKEICTACRGQTRVLNEERDSLSVYMTKLEEYENDLRVPGYTQEESQPALRFLISWLHLSIGLELATRAVTCLDRHEGKTLMKKVDCHLQQARATDLVNVRLAKVTILLRLEKLEECFMFLQELENSWSFHVLAYCPCMQHYSRIHLHNEHQEREALSKWRDMPLEKLVRTHIASCVIFDRSQMELVPIPIRYEMYRSLCIHPDSGNQAQKDWFDQAVMDAKVYFYLLQYMVCSKLDREPHKQIAMDNLASLLQYDDLAHRETAYNLLGWVYLQEDRVADAMWCFQKSWEIRPHHNAAKFHVLVECFKQAQRSQQNN